MGKGHAKQRLQDLAAVISSVPGEVAERRRDQERAYTMLRARLGAEGTYEDAGTADLVGKKDTEGDIFKKSFMHDENKITAYRKGHTPMTLDPEKAAEAALGSTEGRIVSRMTAESEQMLKREGPLWEEMNRSITGGIMEGSSGLMRDQAEILRKQFAKGGSARNRARQSVQELRNMEEVSRIKQQNLWQSSMALNQWSRDNARTQVKFNEGWASNVGGIRESFHKSMDETAQLFIDTAFRTDQLAVRAEGISAAIHASKRSTLSKIGGYALGATAMIAGAATGFVPLTQIGASMIVNQATSGSILSGPGAGLSSGQASGINQGISQIGSIIGLGGSGEKVG